MDPRALLEVIRVQRHDFLNHLQVISGLVQLNKSDRVRDYIREITGDFERMGRIIHLKSPEATAVFLVAGLRAAERQIELDVRIEGDLAGCAVPGAVMERALESVFALALSALAPPEISDRRLRVYLDGKGEHCALRLHWISPDGMDADGLREGLAGVDELLVPCGGETGLTVESDRTEIFILLPRRAEHGLGGT